MKATLPALAVLALATAACGPAEARPEVADSADPGAAAVVAATDEAPALLVYKTETCGCCNGWVDHLRAAGYEVDARNTRDLMSVKRDAGVTPALASCHTALVDGYVVEGHVPADVIARLLAERPDIAGIAVPGMPTGSPGMEGPGAEPYEVIAFGRDGSTSVYAEVDPR